GVDARLLARPRPLVRAQRREARRVVGRAGVAAQQRQLLDRQVELALAGVLQEQVVARDAHDLPRLEAEEPAYAVVGVDEVVADGELRGVVDGLARETLEPPSPLVAVEQLLGEDDLLALGVAVAPLRLLGEDQRDLAGATVDAVAPVRLVLVEDLLAQVAAGALELQEQVNGVAVAPPPVHVLREGGELAAVVAERLERYR